MAKKKPPAGKYDRAAAYVIYARIDPAVGAAFEAFLAETDLPPEKRAVIELALKEFFAKRGKWPPKT